MPLGSRGYETIEVTPKTRQIDIEIVTERRHCRDDQSSNINLGSRIYFASCHSICLASTILWR